MEHLVGFIWLRLGLRLDNYGKITPWKLIYFPFPLLCVLAAVQGTCDKCCIIYVIKYLQNIWSLIVSIGHNIFLFQGPHQYISVSVRMGETGNVNAIPVSSFCHIFQLGEPCKLLNCPVGPKCQHMKPTNCNSKKKLYSKVTDYALTNYIFCKISTVPGCLEIYWHVFELMCLQDHFRGIQAKEERCCQRSGLHRQWSWGRVWG